VGEAPAQSSTRLRLEVDSASQICEAVLQAYAFGNRPGTRFYGLLHYGKHLGNDLTAVALVRA
jgi:hypothetical protein